MSILPGPWSFSGLKKFDTCARQYYETKVAKNFKEPENTEATLYGKEFHTAAENYIRDGSPLPAYFQYAKQYLDTLRGIPGVVYCEHEMGLTEKLEPCAFDDPQAWCRGIADLLIVNEETGTARVLDYKTSKSTKYADLRQLELMALMIFKHFPKVRKVKAGLLFVVVNDWKPATYTLQDEHKYWRTFMPIVHRLEAAHQSGVWNASKSGLCKKHCIVVTCPHNGANQ